jgi:RNA polymerase sigma-70 factor (ECF subfamily)
MRQKSCAENHAREERWQRQMQAAQDGDKAAYHALLTDIVPLLRAVVQRKWRNPQDAEDIIQDILLSVHAVRCTYDPQRPFLPWVLTIARRRIADAARRSSRSAYETTVDVMPKPFPVLKRRMSKKPRDYWAAAWHALADLTVGQRKAVDLLKLQGLSLKEASAITGKSVAALKVNVHRGLKALQRNMTEKG